MITKDKLKILKIIKITLLIVFIPILLFYFGIVLPEYLACINCNSEGAMGRDIWGSEVQCFGDSKEFGEAFFHFSSIILFIFITILTILFFLIHHLKITLK